MYPTKNPSNSQLPSNGVLAHRALEADKSERPGDIIGRYLPKKAVPMQPTLKAALAMAANGLRVFPLQENSKLPLPGISWKQLVTSDPSRIKKLWGDKNYNYAIATGFYAEGKYLVPLDYDVKPDKKTGIKARGAEAFALHEMLDLPTDGMRSDTPTGGWHLFYWSTKEIRNSASKIANGCDARGEGGYVVGPGSIINGVPYVLRDGPIPELPEWVYGLAASKHTKLNSKEELGSEWDTEDNIDRAIHYLEQDAPLAISGVNGNNTSYKVARVLKDLKISPHESAALMLERWNPRLDETWEPDDLHPIVASAHKTGSLPAGIADAKGEFGDLPPSIVASIMDEPPLTAPAITVSKAKRPKLFYTGFLTSAGQALTLIGEPLIKGLLDCGAFSAIYGRYGSGKTFLTLDIAFHIAAGRPWQGRKVKAGLVVYVAAEGGHGIHKRIAALRDHYGVKEDIPLVVVPCPLNLLDKTTGGDTYRLIDLIRKAEGDYGTPAVFIVIDTLSRALAGGDENGPTDM
jgi:AAA domain/Bifunctional DNA primase/polymerase, N-terminal